MANPDAPTYGDPRARFDRVPDGALAALTAAAPDGSQQVVVAVGVDRLVDSIDAPPPAVD